MKVFDDKYFDEFWSPKIKMMPQGGEYRFDQRKYNYMLIAEHIGLGKKVFDYACGLGVLGNWLEGCDYYGCDFSQVAVDFAKDSTGGDIRKTDIIFDGAYDVICACQFIEHIENPVEWVKGALEKAETVICSIPNNFYKQKEHALMQWGNFDEFYELFKDIKCTRIDTPEAYHGCGQAWKAPTFEFKK